MLRGFLAFVMRGNVIDLAVAVVIGAAFTAVVQAFVKDLLTPLIAAIAGKPDFAALAFELHGSVFRYGDFINALISFVLVAAAVYYVVVLPMGAIISRTQRPSEPTTRPCPECLTEIPLAARRCSACASPVQPA
jgi:large conductance mechanosensitive channel